MAKIRINGVEFPFEMTDYQRTTLLNLLDYYKRKLTFKGIIEHVDKSNNLLAYAFAGWCLIQFEKPKYSTDDEGLRLFDNLFGGGKTKS